MRRPFALRGSLVSATPPHDAGAPRYAGFWRRLGATIVDMIVFACIMYVASFVLPDVPFDDDLNAAFSRFASEQTFETFSTVAGLVWNAKPAGPQLVEAVVEGLLLWAYFSIQEASAAQATLGKRLFGIRVGSADGARLGLATASLRAWPHWLGSLSFVVGAWLGILVFLASFVAVVAIAVSPRKQGLHDRMAGALLTRR